MTATIHPFRKSSAPGPRGRASGREAWQCLPVSTVQQAEALRSARQEIAEAWRLRVESAAIKQRYEERRARIELLLAGLPSDVERV
jgi:hypothetical protein